MLQKAEKRMGLADIPGPWFSRVLGTGCGYPGGPGGGEFVLTFVADAGSAWG
jgi:hypothetical protein